MISPSSSIASSQPATSLNVVFGMSLVISLALDLANCMTPRPPPPWAWFIRKMNSRMISAKGSRVASSEPRKLGCGTVELDFSIVPAATCSSTAASEVSCWPSMYWATTLSPSSRVPLSRVAWISKSAPLNSISSTLPSSM